MHVQVTEIEFSKRILKNDLLFPHVPQLALKTNSTIYISQLLPHVPQLALKTYSTALFTASCDTCGNN